MTTLANIVNEARADFDNIGGWVQEFASKHLPALAAEAQRIQESPIAQALEQAAGITPDEEKLIAGLITRLGDLHAATATTADPVTAATALVNVFGTETEPATSEAASDNPSAVSAAV